jgi:DNA-directed RNA polymerase specialized sigma subunit
VEVVVLAECYANKCIAGEIINLLRLRGNTIHKVRSFKDDYVWSLKVHYMWWR